MDGQVFRAGRHYRLLLDDAVTLEQIGRILARVEAEEGPIVVARLVEELDYDRLTALARCWIADPAETANDPNQHISPRHLLLLGMEDPLLPPAEQEGLFPDDEAGPVREATRALNRLGHPCPEGEAFTEEVLQIYLQWRQAGAHSGSKASQG